MSELPPAWSAFWGSLPGLSGETPTWLLAILGLVFTYCVIILPAAAAMAFIDRKLSADFQARVGPNRAGPGGIAQPLADLLKLLQKQDRRDWTWREAFWFSIVTMTLYSTVAVMPLGSLALLVNTDMSVFLPFWAALVLAFGTMLLGFSQGTVPSWFGGVRVAVQALAGAFPALVAVLTAGIRAGQFRWSALADSQGASPHLWAAFSSPFQFLAFVVFVVGGLVLLNVEPMNAGLSVSDIHGGVSSPLYGRRLSLFRLGRFYAFFLWSVIASVVFLGAWKLPFDLGGKLVEGGQWAWLQVLELLWLLAKTFALMILVVWVARVNPRARVDQMTDFAWRVLSPTALIALIGAAAWAGARSLL